jgi:hypothetical protein
MPTSAQILVSLASIANGAASYAVAVHVFVALAAIAWAAGFRIRRRVAVVLFCAPVGAVSVFASVYHVAFNAMVFALLALALLIAGLRSDRAWRAAPSLPLALLGGVLLGFGWMYPHFLETRSPLAYLYASPLGLLPCPTLAFLIGLSLSAGVPGGRLSARVLGAAGLFYGVWGVVKLGVWIDGLLLAGALGLLFATRSSESSAFEPRHASSPNQHA